MVSTPHHASNHRGERAMKGREGRNLAMVPAAVRTEISESKSARTKRVVDLRPGSARRFQKSGGGSAELAKLYTQNEVMYASEILSKIRVLRTPLSSVEACEARVDAIFVLHSAIRLPKLVNCYRRRADAASWSRQPIPLRLEVKLQCELNLTRRNRGRLREAGQASGRF
jgi:hypothetical protein